MNLFHLRYFETLAKTEHYSKAAEMLSITQPSLSYAISTLENELGVKLFEKHGRNVTLTKYGRAFYKDIEVILQKLDNSVRDMKLAASGEGEINIAFVRTLGTDYIPYIIKNYKDLHPEKKILFNINCEESLSVDILQSLSERKYDVAFCSKINNMPFIDFHPVAVQDLVAIVPKDHPLAEKDTITLKDTVQYQHIIFKKKSGLRHIIDDLFHSLNEYPDILTEVEEDHVGAGLVAKGFGIMIAPRFLALEQMDVKIIPISQPSYKRYFYMATLKDVYQPPIVEEFIEFVKKESKINKEFKFG